VTIATPHPIRTDLVAAYFVPGEPVAQPRPKATRQGDFIRMIEAPSKHPIHPWKAALRQDSTRAMAGRAPVDFPIYLELLFVMPRPSDLRTTKKLALVIPHTKRPDLDNCLKAVEDAMTGIVWRDDSLVSTAWLRKRYVLADEGPGVHIWVSRDTSGQAPAEPQLTLEEATA
jgi:Holliday junction resolvase RusA-like endonuclease